MNNRDNTEYRYFRMAVSIVLVSMAALILFRLDHHTKNGKAFFLIMVFLGVILFAICIPLIGYLKKISKNDMDAGCFRVANIFAVFSMVSFVLLRIPEYVSSALYSKLFVMLAICVLETGIMLFIILRVKSSARQAFYIPAVAFILYTLGTVLGGGTNYFFLVYLTICGYGALYSYYEYYRNFVFLSHGIILYLVIARIPFTGPDVPRHDLIFHWMLAAYTTNFFLMFSRLMTEKNSRSGRAQRAFDTLMTATPNLLAMVDDMNRITYISKPLAELAHIEDPETAAGRPIIDLFYDINMKLVIGEILESDGFYDGSLELFHNGKKRYLKITSDKFPGKIGRFIDMSDITPIREALFEAEEAKARAEEANFAKSAFLARMSHEIRTPMNAITGLSELILREKASPAVYEYATSVKQAGSNLVAIINDILDFSKIESGKTEIVPTEYEFASLINDVITIICMRLREKPIYFVVNLDHTIPSKFYGDVVRVRQVLFNLLSNAVKYTNKGHILFTVDVQKWEETSVTLKFEVSDTGIGIRQEDMGKLFGNFSRLDSHQNYEVEGSGLGLAISRNLCRIMEGDVTVQSVYGEGTTFTAYFPQEIRDMTPFAAVSDPETKKVLVYESREIYGNSIVCSIDNLGVSCKLVTRIEDFSYALERDTFNYIFAASFLFDKARKEVRNRGITTTLVLLAEYGEVIADRYTRFIALPAHSLSIAHILNGVDELRGYNEQAVGVRFTAPDAHILIVDDIKTNLTVAEGLLIPYAVQVDSCLNGKEAIRLVQKNRYDLILMDHMMPGMDGIETTAAIREWEKSQRKKDPAISPDGIPIIALTANAVSGMREMFLQNGFSDYLSKPIEIIKLNEIIEKWIPAEKQIKPMGGIIPAPPVPGGSGGLVIEGVDVNRGITMTGGTEAGYRKVLAQFYKDADERLDWLMDFLTEYKQLSRRDAEKSLAEFIIQVHALKSAAGTIGAVDVSKEAATLEEAGKAGDTTAVGELLPAFYVQLSKLVSMIEEVLEMDDQNETGDREGRNDSAVMEKLELLRDALKAKNMKNIDRLLEDLETAAMDSKTREGINAVSDKVLMGEYEGAIDSVTTLLATKER
ncbi:MAG: response regulator [Treponema sp.]|jgi:signal transduction histidine kinase/CheY-like chemotaxis protein/HPt (histidine-containing phosphotransfer) domain-containing protein|nr:response regulator [Treponema sp.]